jgi:hypothetical protein
MSTSPSYRKSTCCWGADCEMLGEEPDQPCWGRVDYQQNHDIEDELGDPCWHHLCRGHAGCFGCYDVERRTSGVDYVPEPAPPGSADPETWVDVQLARAAIDESRREGTIPWDEVKARLGL